MIKKECILYENKICDECGECNICDINPDKICDNCGKCIEGFDYAGVEITGILEKIENDGTASHFEDEKCCSTDHHQHDEYNCKH